MVDHEGMTPLNLAVSAVDDLSIQLAVVEDLTEVNASAGIVRANDGTWPLWNAMDTKFSNCPDINAVLKDLIVSNPASATLTEEATESTVLHRAIQQQIASSVVKDLIKVFPQALEKRDAQGRIPLHVAIECESVFSIIKVLVQKCPDSVEMLNKDGETPHQMAGRLGLDADIVQFLDPFEEEGE